MLGKLLGAMIGAGLGMALAWSPALAAIFGALGALVGHFAIDREQPAPRSLPPPSTQDVLGARSNNQQRKVSVEDQLLVDALCPLFLEVARVDNPALQGEIRVIREFFEQKLEFDDVAMNAVRLKLKADLEAPEQDIEFLTTRARTTLKPSIRVEVVRSLYELGIIDGPLQRSEQDMIKRIVGLLNLSDEQLQEITSAYFGTGHEEYALLGLTAAASDEEVKSAFRKLATEHHPDRAKDNGEKFRAVKDAYESLKKLRGF